MTRMPHPVLLWTANLLVPGAGLVMLGRLKTGVLAAAAWALAGCMWLLYALVWLPEAGGKKPLAAAVIAVGSYAASQLYLGFVSRAMRRHLGGEARDDVFRSALVATLQGRLDDAKNACRALLKSDPDDVEATLHLALVARRQGKAAEARRYLVQARYLDETGRWDLEIGRELADLDAPEVSRPK